MTNFINLRKNDIFINSFINSLSVNDVSRPPKFSVQISTLTIFQIGDISQSEFHQLHKKKEIF